MIFGGFPPIVALGVTVVGFVTMAQDVGADAEAVAQRAFDRLEAIAAGKDAPDLEPLDIEPVDLQSLMAGSAA